MYKYKIEITIDLLEAQFEKSQWVQFLIMIFFKIKIKIKIYHEEGFLK